VKEKKDDPGILSLIGVGTSRGTSKANHTTSSAKHWKIYTASQTLTHGTSRSLDLNQSLQSLEMKPKYTALQASSSGSGSNSKGGTGNSCASIACHPTSGSQRSRTKHHRLGVVITRFVKRNHIASARAAASEATVSALRAAQIS